MSRCDELCEAARAKMREARRAIDNKTGDAQAKLAEARTLTQAAEKARLEENHGS